VIKIAKYTFRLFAKVVEVGKYVVLHNLGFEEHH
jgi:hypothetical protein